LLLAAGQLVREAVEQGAKLDKVRELADPAGDLRARAARDRRCEGDVWATVLVGNRA
jgi:hypothetical protein